jgi:tRNA A-37 threonylcarbamoyl transferase component Bud32
MLRSPDDFLDGRRARVLKDGRTVKAGKVRVDGGRELFLKRYNRKGVFHTIKNIFRPSRASKVWNTYYGLELRGLNAPMPVAYMEERKLRVLRRSYVVCEFISGYVKLHEFIENRWRDMAGAEKKELISAFGREIGRMHRFGWFHGDLKWSNILVKEKEENGDDKRNFYFLDIDGSKLKKSLSHYEIMKDIVRFAREMERYGIYREEMRGFLSSYLREKSAGLQYGILVKALEGRVKQMS